METARDKREEGVDDVKSSWPLRVGLHTCYNGIYSGLIPKRCLSSDCRALYTPPVTPWELVLPDGRALTFEAADHGRISDWGEVVTR